MTCLGCATSIPEGTVLGARAAVGLFFACLCFCAVVLQCTALSGKFYLAMRHLIQAIPMVLAPLFGAWVHTTQSGVIWLSELHTWQLLGLVALSTRVGGGSE